MLTLTLLEFTTQIKELFPDKSSGPSGITNRILQAGDAGFQSLPLLLLSGIGNPTCNLPIGNSPSCNLSIKVMTKTKLTMPPTGAYISITPWPQNLRVSSQLDLQHTLSSTTLSFDCYFVRNSLVALPEALCAQNQIFEFSISGTSHQLGTKPCTQTNDAIYSLISTIQYNKYTLQKHTYVAFVDYSTAYPSVH